MLRKILLILLLVFVIIQFFRPEKNKSNEITEADFLVATNANTTIATTIKSACYDCHSNNTKYPWYAEVAPISWWISDHVKHGKKHLNFSDWTNYSVKKQKHKLKEIIEEVEEHEMPLESYVPMHPEAKLSDQQVNELVSWVKTLQ